MKTNLSISDIHNTIKKIPIASFPNNGITNTEIIADAFFISTSFTEIQGNIKLEKNEVQIKLNCKIPKYFYWTALIILILIITLSLNVDNISDGLIFSTSGMISLGIVYLILDLKKKKLTQQIIDLLELK